MLAFAAIGVRLFDLQARDRSHLSSLGLGQRVRTVTIPAERGNIFDRTGKVLAVSVPQTTIVADPRVDQGPAGVRGEAGADRAGRPGRARGAASNRKSAFAYVARKVDDATAKQVRDARPRRHLVPGRVASLLPQRHRSPAPVVGFVGTDNNGLGGMEYHYDSLLTGKPGQRAGRA